MKDATIGGSIKTEEGLKADSVVVKGGSRCGGPVVARTIEVGKSGPGLTAYLFDQRIRAVVGTSQVEDVYASTCVLGSGSRAKRVFAGTVELGSGCDVDEITYTDEIKMAGHVTIAHPVRKIEELGEPPL